MDLTRDISLTAALTRIASSGVQVSSVIKIGAGSGADVPWVEKYFPGSRTLLVEMDDQFVPDWEKLRESVPSVRWSICAAGSDDRDAFMRKTNRQGGVATMERTHDATPITHRRVDTLTREKGMTGPYFLRFDTHGFESEILKGAPATLAQTSLIQMEVYNDFKLTPFWEMIPHMRSLGFRLIDMCDPMFRADGAFWHMHLFFVREDHPAFLRNSFNLTPA